MKSEYPLYVAIVAATVVVAWALVRSDREDPRACPPARRVDNFCKTSLPGGVIWLREIPGARQGAQ